jgi:hypothetical protein
MSGRRDGSKEPTGKLLALASELQAEGYIFMAMQVSERTGTTERPLGEFSADIASRLQSNHLDWQRLTGTPQFDYPIDYSVAVTRVDRAAGQIEFLAQWASNAYCHYHRHLGRTASWVIQGEHHLVETTETQTLHKIRRPGFRGQSPAGEIHMEYGGADGSTVLFLCEAVDGNLFDIVAKDGTILATATLEEFASGRLR